MHSIWFLRNDTLSQVYSYFFYISLFYCNQIVVMILRLGVIINSLNKFSSTTLKSSLVRSLTAVSACAVSGERMSCSENREVEMTSMQKWSKVNTVEHTTPLCVTMVSWQSSPIDCALIMGAATHTVYSYFSQYIYNTQNWRGVNWTVILNKHSHTRRKVRI